MFKVNNKDTKTTPMAGIVFLKKFVFDLLDIVLML